MSENVALKSLKFVERWQIFRLHVVFGKFAFLKSLFFSTVSGWKSIHFSRLGFFPWSYESQKLDRWFISYPKTKLFLRPVHIFEYIPAFKELCMCKVSENVHAWTLKNLSKFGIPQVTKKRSDFVISEFGLCLSQCAKTLPFSSVCDTFSTVGKICFQTFYLITIFFWIWNISKVIADFGAPGTVEQISKKYFENKDLSSLKEMTLQRKVERRSQ